MFVFSLVKELGGMTVNDFLGRTTSAELVHWMAFSKMQAEESMKEQLDSTVRARHGR